MKYIIVIALLLIILVSGCFSSSCSKNITVERDDIGRIRCYQSLPILHVDANHAAPYITHELEEITCSLACIEVIK